MNVDELVDDLRAVDGVTFVAAREHVTVQFDVETETVSRLLSAFKQAEHTVTEYNETYHPDGTHFMTGEHDPDGVLDDWRVTNGVQS